MDAWLELFDTVLARWSVPIHERPFRAASMLVKDAVVSVEGYDKDDYLNAPWFGEIVRDVTAWYRERYGADRLEYPEKTAAAVVLIFATPFEVRVPTLPSRPGPKPGTRKLFFTQDLLDDEEPRDWLASPPDLSRLSTEDAAALDDDLRVVCSLTRAVVNGLARSKLGKNLAELSSSLSLHLDRGVAGICSPLPSERSVAVWEFHLAVEKALKLYILQAGGAPPNTHRLDVLRRMTVDYGIPPGTALELGALPTPDLAIKHRYQEVNAPAVSALMDIYGIALRAVGYCANAVERGFIDEHPEITIQALAWHPSRREEG